MTTAAATGVASEYVPSRQHQVSGTSFGHDPNIQSSTIENLDDDDDEDVYDPNKPTLFQKIQNQTNDQSKEKTNNIPANPPQPNQRDEVPVPPDASEDDLNQVSDNHSNNGLFIIPFVLGGYFSRCFSSG